MHIVTFGIDLAKNVFALCGVDAAGKRVQVRASVARAKLAEVVASLLPCLIGTGACTGARHWAGCFPVRSGHAFAPLPAQNVQPHVRRNNTDRAEAAGLLEADRCGGSPRLPVKAPDRQSLPGLRRSREHSEAQRAVASKTFPIRRQALVKRRPWHHL